MTTVTVVHGRSSRANCPSTSCASAACASDSGIRPCCENQSGSKIRELNRRWRRLRHRYFEAACQPSRREPLYGSEPESSRSRTTASIAAITASITDLSFVFLGYFYVRRTGAGMVMAFLWAFGYMTIAVGSTVFVVPVGLVIWLLGIAHTRLLVHRRNRRVSLGQLENS